MQWYFLFFLISGFCSILYEIVWIRIAMAQFGVTTAMVSIVLSVFMIGLGLGSWGAGVVSRKFLAHRPSSALRLYALMECLIGVSAIAVPFLLSLGRSVLLRAIPHMSLSSAYYLPAGIWLGATLVPWCACMGATFPFAMAAIEKTRSRGDGRSFSFLYVANVLGATAGALVPLFLIELFGFRMTLRIAAVLNLFLAASAFGLSLVRDASVSDPVSESSTTPKLAEAEPGWEKKSLYLLFGTGLTSMGVEVVWVRLYTPTLSTVVYAFAAILGTYLVAMYLGSWAYRRLKGNYLESGLLWITLGVSVVLAFVTADPRFRMPAILRVELGIMPLSGLMGFITPAIVDRFSRGDPDRAGRAYAVNILGCVLGPLFAGFVLLPFVGERWSLCLLSLPWFLLGFKQLANSLMPARSPLSYRRWVLPLVLTFGSAAAAISTKGFEEQYERREVRRDSTATVVATSSAKGKSLFVNGVGITKLTTITKLMVHLPMAFLPRQPQNGLVICFGMGTSHLAMLSWDVDATAVELVPSVPSLVTFFHPNAAPLMGSPRSHVVIDDGRFYLEHSRETYDVITIDPPPPIEAAGSSLLYSKEFYATVRQHLRPGGILQQYFPGGDAAVTASVARALSDSFPYIRAFHSIEQYGVHYLASANPIPSLSADELASKLPPPAARDLLEWGSAADVKQQFQRMLNNELSVAALIQGAPNVPALQDDYPVNEYFVLRRLRDPAFQQRIWEHVTGRSESF